MEKELYLTPEERSTIESLVSVFEGFPAFVLSDKTTRKSPASKAFLEELRDRLWGDLCLAAPPLGFSVPSEYVVGFCEAAARFRHHYRQLVVECGTEKTKSGQYPSGYRMFCVAKLAATLTTPVAQRFESHLLGDDSLEF